MVEAQINGRQPAKTFVQRMTRKRKNIPHSNFLCRAEYYGGNQSTPCHCPNRPNGPAIYIYMCPSQLPGQLSGCQRAVSSALWRIELKLTHPPPRQSNPRQHPHTNAPRAPPTSSPPPHLSTPPR